MNKPSGNGQGINWFGMRHPRKLQHLLGRKVAQTKQKGCMGTNIGRFRDNAIDSSSDKKFGTNHTQGGNGSGNGQGNLTWSSNRHGFWFRHGLFQTQHLVEGEKSYA